MKLISVLNNSSSLKLTENALNFHNSDQQDVWLPWLRTCVFALLGCYIPYDGICLPPFRDGLSFEDRTDGLFRNVSEHLPTYAA
jgi:hypothetical protein